MISQSALFLIGILYLGSLFLIAYITDKGFIPKKIINHPLVFVLSLGIFAGSWAIHGAVGFAHESGYNYLTFYIGISAAYFIAPVLLSPILTLSKRYQLNSLADLLAFRYSSPFLGKLVTIFMIVLITPLLAAQIQSVASSIQHMTHDGSTNQLAIIFCAFIILFTMIFGAQHFDNKDKKHHGLVMAIAFESLFKLIVMMAIALFCFFIVFKDHQGLKSWLAANPENLTNMYQPMIHGNWPTLVLIFFSASFAMPHMYHMAFTENDKNKLLHIASWGLPLYLLITALCVPPIVWAGIKLFPNEPVAFNYIAINISEAYNTPIIGLLSYLAGISAASGIIIISTLALASMSLNHLIPLNKTRSTTGNYLYQWLRLRRNILITSIIISSYAVYRVIDHQQTLSQLIILAYTAAVQFLPAVLAALFWKESNRQGIVLGLLAGFSVWLISFYLPLVIKLDPLGLFNVLGIEITYLGIQVNNRDWHFITISSLAINSIILILVSLLSPTRKEETRAANQFLQGNLSHQRYQQLAIDNAAEFQPRLSEALGSKVAEQEVNSAMQELGLQNTESRPFMLQKLRYRIETNLSRLLGPSRAQEIISQSIPFHKDMAEEQDMSAMEGKLEEYQYRLTGLAAELNNLRKFHRQTLMDLPIGVCALAYNQEIVTWNKHLENITGLRNTLTIGDYLRNIPAPWGELLIEFATSSDTHWHRKKLSINGQDHWFNLHKAKIDETQYGKHQRADTALNAHETQQYGLALLVEDVSQLLKLEAKLSHSERLASVGRMAAGVAHEIGNPITGIDCLAQNMLHDLRHIDTKNLPEDSLPMLEEIRQQTKRVTRIVQSLMGFSRAGKTTRDNTKVNIYHSLEEAKNLLQLGSYERNIDIQNNSNAQHWVLGDEQLILQVFINLLSNALDASENNSEIHIQSTLGIGCINISIIDFGKGIPTHLLPNIFEPFVSNKEPGEGTGLGLALVHSIVEDHLGTITLENWTQIQPNTTLSGVKAMLSLPSA